MAKKNNGGTRKTVSNNSGKGRLVATAFAKRLKAAKSGSRRSGLKGISGAASGAVAGAMAGDKGKRMMKKTISDMPFKNVQAQRAMQDKPAALSAMRKEKPTKSQGYPNPITKGGKVGYALTDLPHKP